MDLRPEFVDRRVNESAGMTNVIEEVESIISFLEEGSKQIRSSPSPNVTLVLGDSGTGKTTLTWFLTTDLENLVAERATGSSYTIKDPSGAICKSTLDSCTVIPELIVDQRSNNAFYDCPGFGDTRSVAHDIGAAYFARKVISQATALKVIFTVSYNSVSEGGNRHGFTNLVENVSSMFKDIGKYENSLLLVVNKVENHYEETDQGLKLEPDSTIVKDISAFLKDRKKDIEQKLQSENSQNKITLYKNTIQLIDIFVNDRTPESPRIGIFRRPTKPGPLSQMKQFQEEKEALLKMVNEQLKFTVQKEEDFGYTVSDASKVCLLDLQKEVNRGAAKEMSDIGEKLVEHLKKKEMSIDGIDDLVDALQYANDNSMKLKNELANSTTNARSLLQDFMRFLNDLGFDIASGKLPLLSNHCDYLDFIEIVRNQPAIQPEHCLTNVRSHLKTSLANVWRYVDDSVIWYKFLVDIRATLADYSVQQKANIYRSVVEKLKNNTGSVIGENAVDLIQQLFLQVNNDTGRNYEVPHLSEMDEVKVGHLVELLNTLFKPYIEECRDEKLVVKGNNIMVTDVLNLMSECPRPAVEVFALNKVFVDSDFVNNGGQLLLFSPELEVLYGAKVNLNGKDGVRPTLYDWTTEDGAPGGPGESAGGFFGIVHTCRYCDRLTITAVGGRGGAGQDGDNGSPGSDGKKARAMQYVASPYQWMEEWHSRGFHPRCDNYRRRRELFTLIAAAVAGAVATSLLSRKQPQPAPQQHYYMKKITCTVPGIPGENGRNGGDGGRGGEGGNPGQVSFSYKEPQDAANAPKIIVGKGDQGPGGAGGKGGSGGASGATLYQVLIESSQSNELGNVWYEEMGQTKSGTSGTPNKNEQGLQYPEPVQFLNHSATKHEYKNYVEQNVGNSVIGAKLRKFLDFFDTNGKNRRSVGTTAGFNQSQELPLFRHPGKLVKFEQAITTAADSSSGLLGLNEQSEGVTASPLNYNLINGQSNLMLMDVLIRRANGNKYRSQGIKRQPEHDEHAHNLAYSAHIPQ